MGFPMIVGRTIDRLSILVHTAADAGDAQEKFIPFISLKSREAIVFCRERDFFLGEASYGLVLNWGRGRVESGASPVRLRQL